MSEKLCLKWNDFQDNVKTAFQRLRADKYFTDVTLVCEDGKQFESHKVIMVSSSPFFQNLLTRNPHPHPLVYMRGMKSDDLDSILDFLYTGEANVYQENLDSFLFIAEELQLKGLMRSKDGEEEMNSRGNDVKPENSNGIESSKIYSKEKSSFHKRDYVRQDTMTTATSFSEDFQNDSQKSTMLALPPNFSEDLQQLDDKVQSMLAKTDKMVNGQRAFVCKVCGKEGKSQNIKRHIEAKHIEEAIFHPCNLCEKTCRSRNALWEHQHKEH